MKTVCIVVPCYNEEGNIYLLHQKLQSVFESELNKEYSFRLLLVNDGSSDNTIGEIKALHEEYGNVDYISFSRNFGHQNAIKAGIDHAGADAVITMDADLQHPPALIPGMLSYWKEGYDIVNMKRIDNEKQSWFKKTSSRLFYKIINLFSYVEIESGSADFRLMDRKVVNELKKWNEYNLFYRGIIPWLGFKQHSIDYSADARRVGETKYTIKKMFSFAINGITSFSIRPLRLSILIGLLLSFAAIIYMGYAIYINLFTNQAIQGWTSMIVSVLLIGGLNLLMLGIIGEYLGKLFIENKKRPNYIIDQIEINYE